ncbi:hypothetical protein [Qipengyuania spongiae]|uniref:Secreted protein n=1 Tax=Qipengyuania spongiae TaxID=2909673 RepID=A0ABY5SVX6_9SPHN|nr:hypothetical protein [Qipengyuania spongiae]UVI38708.1 hypothetical protein L1F33_10665 [Qipengyuania spongiae]
MNLKLTITICLGLLLMVAVALRDEGTVDRIAQSEGTTVGDGSVARIEMPSSAAQASLSPSGTGDSAIDVAPFPSSPEAFWPPATSGTVPVYEPRSVRIEVPQQVIDPEAAADSPIR